MIRGRFRRDRSPSGPDRDELEFVAIDTSELTGLFAAPGWLRDGGLTAWLLVGVFVLTGAVIWLLSITDSIVAPVIAASVIATVIAPVVAWLTRHHVPRVIAAILVLLAVIALSVLVFYVVITGITSETEGLKDHLSDSKDTLAGWLEDLGADPGTSSDAVKDASSQSTDAVSALLGGITHGLKSLSSLLFFLAMTALSLIFLLADGPNIRKWGERHMGVPEPVARTISNRTMQSLRGYFVGVTIVAAFNAVVVGLGAVLLGVPLAGTIAMITFLGAYVPYLGAWTAGAFSVLLALGGAGTDAAVGMIVIQILANGVLQQMVQPLAMGAALGIHPLAVLIVTIAGGCLFGTVGLVLAGPITSAIMRISADLSKARAAEPKAPPEPAPAGA